MMHPIEIKCSKCGKCVEVATTSNPLDFNSDNFDTECNEDECPINSSNRPKSGENVSIYFVECE